ncbi:MAG: glycoside hydrolase family 97 protein [Prevotella sp.]|nr:glycoside hydrolase family 97 protein [Prevotella sp.]
MYRSIVLFLLAVSMMTVRAQQVVSPDGKLSVEQKDRGMAVSFNRQQVLDIPVLGYHVTANPNPLVFSRKIVDDYTMLSGKRLRCHNEANEYTAAIGKDVTMVLRLYNDGIAFRYELTGLAADTMPSELTTWRIPEGTRRWMQNWTDSYEEYFPLSTTANVAPRLPYYARNEHGYACRWGYPALIEPADGVFVLISESNIERGQSASCLFNEQELFRVTPAACDARTGQWHSPWRIAIIGSLADVVQSTLVTDVAEPCRLDDTSWIEPGVVSWIYWANNHGSNDYDIICRYVDMAVKLQLPYVLIDAEWDQMKNGKTVEDAVEYALSKGIKPMIWYNSSVGWIDGAPTPKFRLNKAEDREKEFAWCQQIGVAGVKIDFFSGDNQMNMDYCIDLLESAARHHLLINFHGATVPRGWQRTYPHLLSTEGVLGAEWYNNNNVFTNRAAAHNATLPFTRNVIGPMDYTPCAFSDSQYPHITTNGHELALTVLFESGLQHLADSPESFLSQPADVQTFLSQLPTVWDETRLVSGYPGEQVVLARRSGTTWYVAGINGTNDVQTISLDLSFVKSRKVTVYTDTASQPWHIYTPNAIPSTMTCQPRGGFVFVVR